MAVRTCPTTRGDAARRDGYPCQDVPYDERDGARRDGYPCQDLTRKEEMRR